MLAKFYLFSLLSLIIILGCSPENSNLSFEKPEDNRFTKVILTEGMDEPMEMAFLPNQRVIIVERKGGVKIYDEAEEEMIQVATIPVNTKYTNKEGRVREAEEGLMGVIAHPDYNNNHWIFMYYADPDTPKHVLARWELNDNVLDESSKIIVLEVKTQREECCHTGGGMIFDKDGNLYLTVGNNTVNPRSGASNMDERPGFESSDDQRGPSNTNDLRGKILRIHPEDDGSYTIPTGNLYPEGTEKTRPEIYTMGHRNPWRPTLDSKTGYLYWGEVGPDAAIDSIWGPRGYDEFNQAKGPGYFGWPYFIGNNRPYNSYDATNETYGTPFDPEKVVNNSVNNTGLKELPNPIPAFIYYPYGPSEEFPLVGSSGRSATGGPVFRKADFVNAPRTFPPYYEGKWFIVDFMRDWIMAVTMDANGDYESMERFLPNENFSAVIDMDFGPSGDLYILEYGDAWFRKNLNSRLVKLEYNAGNRKPHVVATSDKIAGAVPFTAHFSSKGTTDFDAYDDDQLKYQWSIVSKNGKSENFNTPSPELEFTEPGIYNVTLVVTDTKGESNQGSIEIVAGNEPPVVSIDLKGANRSFYFGDATLPYEIKIEDAEDGSSVDGKVKENEAAITFDYIPSGFDPIEIASKQIGAEQLAVDAIAKNLIESSDCKSCHQYDAPSIGPSYAAVTKKYKDTPETRSLLQDHIVNGSSGIWGEHAMAAHPQLSDDHARRMVQYIMTFQKPKATIESMKLKGELHPLLPDGEDGSGVFCLRVAYTDKGVSDLKALSSDAQILLRNPVVTPQSADSESNTQLLTTPRTNFFVLGPEAHLEYTQLDLTHILEIEAIVQVSQRVGALGGTIEIRIDSPEGKLIGQSSEIGEVSIPRRQFGQRLPPPTTPEEIKARRRQGFQTISIAIEKVEGMHNVYIVFKNEAAINKEILMTVLEFEFLKDQMSGVKDPL